MTAFTQSTALATALATLCARWESVDDDMTSIWDSIAQNANLTRELFNQYEHRLNTPRRVLYILKFSKHARDFLDLADEEYTQHIINDALGDEHNARALKLRAADGRPLRRDEYIHFTITPALACVILDGMDYSQPADYTVHGSATTGVRATMHGNVTAYGYSCSTPRWLRNCTWPALQVILAFAPAELWRSGEPSTSVYPPIDTICWRCAAMCKWLSLEQAVAHSTHVHPTFWAENALITPAFITEHMNIVHWDRLSTNTVFLRAHANWLITHHKRELHLPDITKRAPFDVLTAHYPLDVLLNQRTCDAGDPCSGRAHSGDRTTVRVDEAALADNSTCPLEILDRLTPAVDWDCVAAAIEC